MRCNTCKIEMRIDAENAEQYCPRCGLVEDYFEDAASTNPISAMKAGTFKIGKIIKQHSLLTYNEKKIEDASKQLSFIQGKLNLSYKVKEDALFIYKALIDNNLTKSRKKHELICACVYIAAKRANRDIYFEDFSSCYLVNSDYIRSSYKYIVKNISISLSHCNVEEMLGNLFIKFNISYRHRLFANRLLKRLKKYNYAEGKNPKTLAASILYMTAKNKNVMLSQWKICSFLNIHPVTLHNSYFDIEQRLEQHA